MSTVYTIISVLAVGIATLVYLLYSKIKASLYGVPPIPTLENTWWGSGDPSKEDTSIKPFKINVSDEVLKDLQHRLENTFPFQPPLEGVKQNYGINTKLLETIVEFWRTTYNWRERESFLNQYPQFTVSVQGLNLHYIHVKPTETKDIKVLPLLLLHGWPGSVREFYEIIPLLTTPQKGKDFVFEIIVPSLPGYGFSKAAAKPGLEPVEIALIFKNFMDRLGFKKYYIQGGDWGSLIVQNMATLFPENIIGVHFNMCHISTLLSTLKRFLGIFYPSLIVSKEHEHRMYPLSKIFSFMILESGYLHIQSSKPDTIGVALRDSPVGLAAYILEKFTTWTNPEWKNLDDGGLTKKYTLTQLLDNVMIYWITRSITTSMRLYAEVYTKSQQSEIGRIPIEVPSAFARFSYEVFFEPDSILKDKFKKLLQISDLEGGHFAAFEVPQVLAEDIYAFAEKVQALKETQ